MLPKLEAAVMHIKHLDDLSFIIGTPDVFSSDRTVPFDSLVIDFLHDLSQLVLSDVQAKKFPDLITFSFFCRKANIKQIQSQYGAMENRVGWGLALHIAPSNIPLCFAYSFLFGLISGNCNIVRLSKKDYPQVDLLCNFIEEIIGKPKYRELRTKNAIVKFDKASIFLQENACLFDVRLVWGGDKTIENMRQYSWSPHCIEVAFADRYSISVFEVEAMLQLNAQQMQKLCKGFFNDTFLVDQNACSSPRLIFWLGKYEQMKEVRIFFWQIFAEYVDCNYKLALVSYVEKQIKLLQILEQYDVHLKIEAFGHSILTAWQENVYSFNANFKSPFGLFFESSSSSLDDLFAVVTRQYQTLIYFGISKNLLRQKLANSGVKGIDRVVPVGQALAIGLKWDGIDLLMRLTRYINFV